MIFIDPKSPNILLARQNYSESCSKYIIERYKKAKDCKRIHKNSRSIKVPSSTFQLFDSHIIPVLDSIIRDLPDVIYKISTDILNKVKDDKSKGKFLNLIRYVFYYDGFMQRNDRQHAYMLSDSLGVRTCPYCNRNYTNTIVGEGDRKICRPNFDHYFEKENHPILALSFYNLIPSCSICNSSIKGSKSFHLNTHAHPYSDRSIEKLFFNFIPQSNSLRKYKIRIDCGGDNRLEKLVSDFELEEIYNSHIPELEDLIKLNSYYGNRYLEILKKGILASIPVDDDEIFRIIFGIEIHSSKFVNRPLSKFKHDILIELGIIPP